MQSTSLKCAFRDYEYFKNRVHHLMKVTSLSMVKTVFYFVFKIFCQEMIYIFFKTN